MAKLITSNWECPNCSFANPSSEKICMRITCNKTMLTKPMVLYWSYKLNDPINGYGYKKIHEGFLYISPDPWTKYFAVLWDDGTLRISKKRQRISAMHNANVTEEIKMQHIDEICKFSLDKNIIINPFCFSMVSHQLKIKWGFGCYTEKHLSDWIFILKHLSDWIANKDNKTSDDNDDDKKVMSLWDCSVCTFQNSDHFRNCSRCNTPRKKKLIDQPSVKSPPKDNYKSVDDNDDKKEIILWEFKEPKTKLWKAWNSEISLMIENIKIGASYSFENDKNASCLITRVTESTAVYIDLVKQESLFSKRCSKMQSNILSKPVQPIENPIPHPTYIQPNCYYFGIASKIIATQFPNIPATSFDMSGDRCYCIDCHSRRGDKIIYTRGYPPKRYGLPVGWARLGLKADEGFCSMHSVWNDWHAGYHGTNQENVPNIFNSRLTLLKAGDITFGGYKLGIKKHHISQPFKRYNQYTNKREMFDPNQIYVSPSIKYAANETYAPMVEVDDMNVQYAFQVRIRPGSYSIGQQTINATTKIDQHFRNEELEWYTKENLAVVLVGLLVRWIGIEYDD